MLRANPQISRLRSAKAMTSGGMSLGVKGLTLSRLLCASAARVIFLRQVVIPDSTNAKVSGDDCEYDVSTPMDNWTKSYSAAFAAVMMCRGSRLNTRPVARPLRPKILFLYSFVPLGTLRIICAFLASDRPALWSKEKNQYTQPCSGVSRIISAISRGVSRSHSGSGLNLLIYSAYTGRFGLSGFRVASR